MCKDETSKMARAMRPRSEPLRMKVPSSRSHGSCNPMNPARDVDRSSAQDNVRVLNNEKMLLRPLPYCLSQKEAAASWAAESKAVSSEREDHQCLKTGKNTTDLQKLHPKRHASSKPLAMISFDPRPSILILPMSYRGFQQAKTSNE